MDIVDRLQNKKRNTTDEEDDALTEIQTLRAKVASADVLVEALSTIRHDAYMDGSTNKTVIDIYKEADKAIMTYDKLSEVKHGTNK